MKNSREVALLPADVAVTDVVAAEAPAHADPSAGGSFIRQPDGSLQRNPAHPEPKQQLVRRPPTPSA